MNCTCGGETIVKDSRPHDEGGQWRRRLCVSCKLAFTTIEVRCETANGRKISGDMVEAAKKCIKHPKAGKPRATRGENPVQKRRKKKITLLNTEAQIFSGWGRPEEKVKPPTPVREKVNHLPELTVTADEQDIENTPARKRIEELKELAALRRMDDDPYK